MSTPDLDKFAGRPFSFYPPILGIEHNEWVYRKGSWSEVLVGNTKMETELWVPRRFLGDVSQVDKPVMIVGLSQELEYKGGAVWPHKRRVLAMPAATAPAPAELKPGGPPRQRESATDVKIERLVAGALIVGVIATALLVAFFRGRESGGRITYEAVLQQDLNLTAEDNYFSVVRKLGEPEKVRWRSEQGERQYEALEYPRLGVTVILMGADRKEMLYIGAKDKNWKNVHSVTLPSGTGTDSILRSLPRF
ncbi:MAG: hypothetical protein KIT09_12425 [Bryobacteraceae bacterium]|nr:hypothetical protein [Bryobacteraceae bacterium]